MLHAEITVKGNFIQVTTNTTETHGLFPTTGCYMWVSHARDKICADKVYIAIMMINFQKDHTYSARLIKDFTYVLITCTL